ncbi:hypothetical protein O181_029057 [Austropuccinia psidii MF-1]|uniref:Uncharacterized protein n=1 Tax=Austropuccinia psidii MF-1 TaxID=1389203 RepID=A0A9Q3H365_9BASI|nr:hypothetical protein [Austropuccinia psidii MF-1]
MINIIKTHKNSRVSVEDLKEPRIKIEREPSRFELIEIGLKRRGRPPSELNSTTTSISQSIEPSPIKEMDSSEDCKYSQASLSKSIRSSDSLPSDTESNEYDKSGVTLRRSRRLAMGRKTSQRIPTGLKQV